MAEVVLLAGAEADTFLVYSGLFKSNQDSAERFSQHFDRALFDLETFPQIGTSFSGRFRRKLVPGFYHMGIFYVIEGERVMVHAIIDLRSSPEEIRRRLGV